MEAKKIDNEELFIKYKETKDKKIRDELIVKYLYIAEILSKKFVGRGIEYEDIYQIASLALIYAVERFDITKGYEFTSFATPTVIGEIKKYFRDKGWMIRVPRRLQKLSKEVNNTKTLLEQDYQRHVTVSDIALKINCSEEEVIEAMEAGQVYSTRSLESQKTNENEMDVNLNLLIGEDDPGFNEVDNRDFIEKSLSKLNGVESFIIRKRFLEDKTQVEVANLLEISQMTVSRMEKKLLNKFRNDYNKIYK